MPVYNKPRICRPEFIFLQYSAPMEAAHSHEDQGDRGEYGYTMEEYIGGQIACGFLLSGYVECQMEDITELYFMTRAMKNSKEGI